MGQVKETKPFEVYSLLTKVLSTFAPRDYFIITSNNQGFLETSGFPMAKVWEVNGNINFFQSEDGTIHKASNFDKSQKRTSKSEGDVHIPTLSKGMG